MEDSEAWMTLSMDPELLLQHAANAKSFSAFEKAITREWELTCKVEHLSQLGLLRSIAELIPGGDMDDPIGEILELSPEKLHDFCSTSISNAVERTFTGKRPGGRGEEQVTVVEDVTTGNSKFLLSEARTAMFGGLEKFHGGLVELIGLPSTDLMLGMAIEHRERGDSDEEFSPGNYDLITTPRQEWETVTNPQQRALCSVLPRRIRAIEEIMEEANVKMAGLRTEEALALQLYTGPMYWKYNTVLRNPPDMLQDPPPDSFVRLRGNKYTTTIYCIVSGTIKLSKVTSLPPSRVVYRGLHGLEMPNKFVSQDAFGVSGGVELGMLSTSQDMNVAIQYAGKGMLPTVFEISCGAVDRGASLNVLSQYPGEEEMLYPPLSYLELIKQPQIRVLEGKAVRVLPLKINSNMTCSTIEEILARRKQLFIALLENILDEIERDLTKIMESPALQERLARASFDKTWEGHVKLRQSISKECRAMHNVYKQKDVSWYNDDNNYNFALDQATMLKKMAMNKIEFWLKDTDGDNQSLPISKESLRDVYHSKMAHLYRRVWSNDEDDQSRRQAAVAACKMHGVWTEGEVEESVPPLIRAVLKGQLEMLPLLAAAGCDVKATTHNGMSALHAAVMMGFTRCILQLLEMGADLKSRTEDGLTVVHVGAKHGHVEALKAVIEASGQELLSQVANDGKTCLHYACEHGHVEAVKTITRVGEEALAMAADKYKRTCAHWACMNGQDKALRAVLEVGGMELAMARANDGRTCAHYALQYGQTESLQAALDVGGKELALGSDKSGRSCGHYACGSGDLEGLQVLLKVGGKEMAMAVDSDGRTCAHYACDQGMVEGLRLLLEVGGKELAMASDRYGRTCAQILYKKELTEGLNLILHVCQCELADLVDANLLVKPGDEPDVQKKPQE